MRAKIGTKAQPTEIFGLATLCLILLLLTASTAIARPLVLMGKQIQIDDRFGSMLDPGSPPPAVSPAPRPQASKLHFLIYLGRVDLIWLLQNYDEYIKFRTQLENADRLVIYIPDDMSSADADEFADKVHRMFYNSQISLYAFAAKISMMFDPTFWMRARQPPDVRLLGTARDLGQKVNRVYVDHESSGYCQTRVANSTPIPLKSLICANGFPVYPGRRSGDFEWSVRELRSLSAQIKRIGFKAGILPTGIPLLALEGWSRWDYGELLTRSGADYMIVQTQQYCSPITSKDPSLVTIRRAAEALRSQITQHSLPSDSVAAQISFNGANRVSVERALDCTREFEKAGIWNIFLLEGSIPTRTEFLQSARAK